MRLDITKRPTYGSDGLGWKENGDGILTIVKMLILSLLPCNKNIGRVLRFF